MSLAAYILIKVDPGMEKNISKKISNFDMVKNAVITYGAYDLLVSVEVDSSKELDNFLFNSLRKIDGVKDTTTLIEATISSESS